MTTIHHSGVGDNESLASLSQSVGFRLSSSNVEREMLSFLRAVHSCRGDGRGMKSTSLPPLSGLMNPKPLLIVEEFDVPLGIEFWSRVKCQSLRQAQKDRHDDNKQYRN